MMVPPAFHFMNEYSEEFGELIFTSTEKALDAQDYSVDANGDGGSAIAAPTFSR
jgi:hypothetical protein